MQKCDAHPNFEVLECYRVTGSDALIVKVMASSIEHLEAIIDRLSAHGQLTTSIVLSSPVTRKIITPLAGKMDDEGMQTSA